MYVILGTLREGMECGDDAVSAILSPVVEGVGRGRGLVGLGSHDTARETKSVSLFSSVSSHFPQRHSGQYLRQALSINLGDAEGWGSIVSLYVLCPVSRSNLFP
jgi:hypothetical protein